MPSPPGYHRNYAEERKTAIARGEAKGPGSGHTLRLRARRIEMKKGLVHPHDGKDVDHKKPISKGGGNAPGGSNFRVESAHKNRSYARTKTGAIKP